ncbi:MAG TPA: arginine--tRNA ligase [Acidimicrobiales bacterium]|nr:arginine--tRNA ligase [Acidimicrobiales bacterium]
MSITDALAQAVRATLAEMGIEVPGGAVRLERPARAEHGDFATNAALAAARAARRAPRALAEELARRLAEATLPHVASVEVAGPGFVNFRLDPSWLYEALRELLVAGETGYACPDLGQGERVQVEFVSANPTGPLHVGNGWLGAYGDALARLLGRCNWRVEREYYVNDTGNQIRLLGESLLARRRGEAVPEQGYQGEYVAQLARRYDGPEDVTVAGRFAAEHILENIRSTLARLGIHYDSWYSQASIEESGKVAETIELMRSRGLVYERDGATWLASSRLGDARDRVLVKSDGELTYLAGDLAYHRDKFLVRGFDRVIDVFGADHHGQVASLKAGVAALGIDPSRLEVHLGQLVSLVGGERMSKRSGVYVRLDDLVDDLGPDATRLMALTSSIDQATTLDVDLVKRQSMENPVYYVQYAHARIASIARFAAERGASRPPLEATDLSQLVHERELALLRTLELLPATVAEAALERAPYKVTNWVRRLAGEFHGFYHDCRVVGDGIAPPLAAARLWLVEGTRIGLAIALDLLGVSAPEVM